MLTIVLVVNGVIGLSCLFVAWQLWKLKLKLSRTADTLLSVERSVHNVLHPAPGYILKGQSGTYSLRQKLQKLEPQLERLQQVIGLLGMGRFIWQRGLSLRKSRVGRKRSSARV